MQEEESHQEFHQHYSGFGWDNRNAGAQNPSVPIALKAEKGNVFKVKDCYSYKEDRGSTKPWAQQPGVPPSSGNFECIAIENNRTGHGATCTPTCPRGGLPCSSPAWMTQNTNSCNNKTLGSKAKPWRAGSRGRALQCSLGQSLPQTYPLNNNRSPQPFPPCPKPTNTLGIIHAARIKSTHHRNNSISRYIRCNIKSII